MSTTSTGQRAEAVAAQYLQLSGYTILELNYRRRHCEIDIVARRGNVVYFVEVKYRATDDYGGGLEYITGRKLQRMERGAETWVLGHNWAGEYQLSAVEVSGDEFIVSSFVEQVF